ncbi:bifunctional 3-(3-hydroxy-phenyl)propionate/3-hydroxycinnamic acid hydroxylase [Aurantivibrio infirmus]
MFDVAIIGCGPVGAMAANLLGKAGLETLVIEKEANPFPLPRAVHLDHEMMRLFQAANVIDKVKADMRDTEGHLHVGADHGVIRYMGTVGLDRPFGWSNDYFFYQPELEDHLRNALSKYENVDLRLGTAFISATQKENQVTLTLKNSNDEYQETARWVIACDGASSSVRNSLGIQLDDLHFEEPWLVVDADVDGPVQFPNLTGVPAEANLQQLSVMMCDPSRPATIVPGRGNLRRWELMLLPGEDDNEMMKPEVVAELLKPWLEGVPHKIVRASTYRFHGLIAEQWRDGNIFLAGDAAHQTPPFFGQGMCHGLRDVANLAWKMSMILQGTAPENILDTYQTERDPHVRAVISAAVEAGRYICILDKEKAAQRDNEIRSQSKAQSLASTAAELIPAITNGIVAAHTTHAGERFIQPKMKLENNHLENNREILLDDVTKNSWRLFVKDTNIASGAKKFIRNYLSDVDISVYNASSLADQGAILKWLEDSQLTGVLVRPDFYIFGTCRDSSTPLLKEFSEKLKNPNPEHKNVA